MNQMHRFKSAWLTTNRSCNNRCDWCYARKVLNPLQVMSLEDAKLAVDMLQEHGVQKIVLIGGEPTVYPHLIELIGYISKKGIVVSLATNGRKFENYEFAKKVIDAGVGGINISLKATSEEEYLRNTHQHGLEEALKGVRNLKLLGFEPVVSYVIVDDSKKDFNKLVELMKKENISKVILQFVKPALELNERDDIMDITAMGEFVEYIYGVISQTEIDYTLEVSFPICLIKEEILEKLIGEGRIVTCCHIQRGNGIIFDTDFKVLPCNHFAEYPFSDKPIDLASENAIDDLWETEDVQEFRKVAKCYPSIKCKMCNLWDICGGGCFTRWFYLNPSEYIG